MPLYEYECAQCHRRVEKIQKFSDAPLTICPHCGGALERTLTAPAVQFKGSGWYKDLYSSAKPASAGSENGGAAASKDTASTTGGDAKPATAPATPAPASTPASTTSSSTSGS